MTGQPQKPNGRPRTKEGITSWRRVRATVRESECLALRLKRLSYPEIGRQLGIDASNAYRHVKRGMVRARAHADAGAAQLRFVELQRLDVAIDVLLPRVLASDDVAIALYLRALKQRADLLGLTAHVRLVGPDGGPVQLQPVPAAPEPLRLGTPSLQAALDTLPDEQLEQIVAISGRLKAALTPPTAPLPGGPIIDVTAHEGGDRPLPRWAVRSTAFGTRRSSLRRPGVGRGCRRVRWRPG